MSLLRRLVHRAYLGQTAGAWRNFLQAKENPEAAQKAILFETLGTNRDSDYGKKYGFSEIRSIQDFRNQVPIVRHADLVPWLDRMVLGEAGVLTQSKVLIFERTSGSTQANKWIPYNRQVLGQFSSVVSAWMHNLLMSRPSIQGGASYWSVSQAVKKRERTPGGTPVGFESDVEYLGRLERWAWGILIVGGEKFSKRVSKLATIQEWKDETAIALLEERDLSFVSVWSPTFLSGILDQISKDYSRLLQRVSRRRRKELPVNFSGNADWAAIWPRFQTLSCWMDGPSETLGQKLQARLPGVWVQPKGLLATEGVVSFPVLDHGVTQMPVAAHSMYLEFAAVDQSGSADFSKVHSAWELKKGETYTPILTTKGGLYRYHLSDVVICDGHYGLLPSIRFLSKLDRISDQVGEKLNAQFVQGVVQSVLKKYAVNPDFVLLAPSSESGLLHYRFFIEGKDGADRIQKVLSDLDQGLSENQHYAYCRKLGQLNAIQVTWVNDGIAKYEAHLTAQGMKMGDIKPTVLDHRLGWEKAFA
ncbi:MAG: GH3 auxin-responsive promoter family protein [Bdellovibrionales bacterium]|nr:GH3 auxin-responsive promoter family protein [Bdellovibrionales bacterium]